MYILALSKKIESSVRKIREEGHAVNAAVQQDQEEIS